MTCPSLWLGFVFFVATSLSVMTLTIALIAAVCLVVAAFTSFALLIKTISIRIADVSLKEAQERLAHNDIQTTSNRYNHVMQEKKDSTASLFPNFMLK